MAVTVTDSLGVCVVDKSNCPENGSPVVWSEMDECKTSNKCLDVAHMHAEAIVLEDTLRA